MNAYKGGYEWHSRSSYEKHKRDTYAAFFCRVTLGSNVILTRGSELNSTISQVLKRIFGRRGLLRGGHRADIQRRMATAYGRASATAAARDIDPVQPLSWEFSGFSQHGEDGIVDYLCSRMTTRNRYFMEIGAADGLQNCSAWLALARRYGGVMVEGNPDLSRYCTDVLHEARCHNVVAVNQRVEQENIEALMKLCPHTDPDVFIIDIDGIDYYIVERVLGLGFRPKLIVVEYNSVFGPEQAVTVPYDGRFSRRTAHPSLLYYGVSIAAWRVLMEDTGYVFVTVESNGTNAFFVQSAAFPEGFVAALQGTEFLNNVSDRNGETKPVADAAGNLVVPPRDWQAQFERIQDKPLVHVTRSDRR